MPIIRCCKKIIFVVIAAIAIMSALDFNNLCLAAGGKKSTGSPSKIISNLLKTGSVVYWYSSATDADHPALAADGTLDTAKLLEGDNFSEKYRQLLRSMGIIAVAHVEISPESAPEELYKDIRKPLASGWDAVALDEFSPDDTSANLSVALKRIKKEFPGRGIILWARPGPALASLEKLLDLVIILPGRPPDAKVFLSESGADAPAIRYTKASSEIRTSNSAGASILKKSIMAVCSCDSFSDISETPDAFICNDRSEVDFRAFLDLQLYELTRRTDFAHGAAFFSWNRTGTETARFINKIADRYFLKRVKNRYYVSGSENSLIKDSGFEEEQTRIWRLEGSGVKNVTYRDAGPALKLRIGHAYSQNGNADGGIKAEVGHGLKVLRMDGAPQSCNAASQNIKLHPGATYALTAYVAGARGGERASIYIVDAVKGKERFSAFQPIESVASSHWIDARAMFTLPEDTSEVSISLSDCDARTKQTIWWDFVELQMIANDSPEPAMISATPVYNTVEGRGFRIVWTPLPGKNVSHYLVQFSIDGRSWMNIASEFDGTYYVDWFPSGMKFLPFDKLPPGQGAFFRVKAKFWNDKETGWSAPYRTIMPLVGAEKEPILLYGVSKSRFGHGRNSGLRAQWTAPRSDKPVRYEFFLKKQNGQWKKAAQSSYGSTFMDIPAASYGDAYLLRMKAVYKDGEEAFSNIVPQLR